MYSTCAPTHRYHVYYFPRKKWAECLFLTSSISRQSKLQLQENCYTLWRKINQPFWSINFSMRVKAYTIATYHLTLSTCAQGVITALTLCVRLCVCVHVCVYVCFKSLLTSFQVYMTKSTCQLTFRYFFFAESCKKLSVRRYSSFHAHFVISGAN